MFSNDPTSIECTAFTTPAIGGSLTNAARIGPAAATGNDGCVSPATPAGIAGPASSARSVGPAGQASVVGTITAHSGIQDVNITHAQALKWPIDTANAYTINVLHMHLPNIPGRTAEHPGHRNDACAKQGRNRVLGLRPRIPHGRSPHDDACLRHCGLRPGSERIPSATQRLFVSSRSVACRTAVPPYKSYGTA